MGWLDGCRVGCAEGRAVLGLADTGFLEGLEGGKVGRRVGLEGA